MPPSSRTRSAAGSVIREEGFGATVCSSEGADKSAPSSFVGGAEFAHCSVGASGRGWRLGRHPRYGKPVPIEAVESRIPPTTSHQKKGVRGGNMVSPPKTRKGRLLAALLPSGRWGGGLLTHRLWPPHRVYLVRGNLLRKGRRPDESGSGSTTNVLCRLVDDQRDERVRVEDVRHLRSSAACSSRRALSRSFSVGVVITPLTAPRAAATGSLGTRVIPH
jgi:hypothetical protein